MSEKFLVGRCPECGVIIAAVLVRLGAATVGEAVKENVRCGLVTAVETGPLSISLAGVCPHFRDSGVGGDANDA